MREHNKDSAEKRRLVKEWDESGLSAQAFAEAHGLHPQTLRVWGRAVRGPLRKRARTRPPARTVELVELPKDDTGELRVEVEFPGGRRLVVAGALTADLLVALIATLDPGDGR